MSFAQPVTNHITGRVPVFVGEPQCHAFGHPDAAYGHPNAAFGLPIAQPLGDAFPGSLRLTVAHTFSYAVAEPVPLAHIQSNTYSLPNSEPVAFRLPLGEPRRFAFREPHPCANSHEHSHSHSVGHANAFCDADPNRYGYSDPYGDANAFRYVQRGRRSDRDSHANRLRYTLSNRKRVAH